MNQVFRETHLQKQFENDGYATFPLLNADEVSNLQQAYRDLDHLDHNGFHCSMFNPDVGYRQKVDSLIKDAVGSKLDPILNSYRKLFSNFMVKEPDQQSDWEVHQDWTYVDESKYTSVALWFPLTDVDETNGALHVVPGSHKIQNFIRGPGVANPFKNMNEEIRTKYSRMVPLQAGEAIVWHHRLLHFSPPNRGQDSRIAATIIMVPSEAEVYHHWCNENDVNREIERFVVDTDFFMNYAIKQRPNARSIGKVNYSFRTLAENELSKVLSGNQSNYNKLLRKIQKLFKKPAYD